MWPWKRYVGERLGFEVWIGHLLALCLGPNFLTFLPLCIIIGKSLIHNDYFHYGYLVHIPHISEFFFFISSAPLQSLNSLLSQMRTRIFSPALVNYLYDIYCSNVHRVLNIVFGTKSIQETEMIVFVKTPMLLLLYL